MRITIVLSLLSSPCNKPTTPQPAPPPRRVYSAAAHGGRRCGLRRCNRPRATPCRLPMDNRVSPLVSNEPFTFLRSYKMELWGNDRRRREGRVRRRFEKWGRRREEEKRKTCKKL
ncbi:hypothetical protein GW17_00017660 [Ensete ventricosum]|nr:hypothetical protein GW17_00017660 [Ensete ventricosum]